MELTVIIINFNVKYFLEQCLCSVAKAIKGIEAEVIVVDNASHDGSAAYLCRKFPFARFIINSENSGFSKANNMALKEAKGEFILFLNPDTIVSENCFNLCISFMKEHSGSGALGIRMIDGSGNFLPESKRSFPSPVTSLFKLIGLNALFPKSKIFARYRLGHLDQHSNHEVDVLSGAFMLVRKEILVQLNGFDESFYMYGEDIDLSYRIQRAGYKNYYFSGCTIIHFKGESTKKGSLNYVRMFYHAMSIFVKKHYSGSNARVFGMFIHTGIWLRALFSIVNKFFFKIGLPLFDALIILCSFKLVNYLWIVHVRGGYGFMYEVADIALPGFTAVFLFAASLAGIYDNRYRPLKALYAAVVAIVVMLAVYSLFPEKYRFSRGVILFGGLAALVSVTAFRWLLLALRIVPISDEIKNRQHTLVYGARPDFAEVKKLLLNAGYKKKNLVHINATAKHANTARSFKQLKTLVETMPLREVIFCEGYLSFQQLIQHLQELPSSVEVKIHAKGSESIIGSDSKDTAGEFLSSEGSFRLSDPYQRRMKRTIDVFLALVVLISFPVQVIVAGYRIIIRAFYVLTGNNTWIGYSAGNKTLPPLAKGILAATGQRLRSTHTFTDENLTVDLWYARTYDWMQDVKLIAKHFRKLGAE